MQVGGRAGRAAAMPCSRTIERSIANQKSSISPGAKSARKSIVLAGVEVELEARRGGRALDDRARVDHELSHAGRVAPRVDHLHAAPA